MLDLSLILVLQIVIPFAIGGTGVWLYYRNKFTEVLTELEDKKLIIKTIHDHADLLERENVKKTTTPKVKQEKPKKTSNEVVTKKRGRKSTNNK
jgi:hypothetical protein